jgi:hypothetical protein
MLKTIDKTSLKLSLLLVALFALTTTSYLYFSMYQPKILRKVEEVKGIKKVSSIELLYPENAEVISLSQTMSGSQASYKTLKSQEYMQTFYRNLFLDMGWEEESVRKFDDSLIYKFKTVGKVSTIIMQADGNSTLVSLEISKR